MLMKTYYRSQPHVIGYRNRMWNLWREDGMFEATEQKLADQARQVLKMKRLSDVELEEIRRGIPKLTKK